MVTVTILIMLNITLALWLVRQGKDLSLEQAELSEARIKYINLTVRREEIIQSEVNRIIEEYYSEDRACEAEFLRDHRQPLRIV